jgi:hypothetical protein
MKRQAMTVEAGRNTTPERFAYGNPRNRRLFGNMVDAFHLIVVIVSAPQRPLASASTGR